MISLFNLSSTTPTCNFDYLFNSNICADACPSERPQLKVAVKVENKNLKVLLQNAQYFYKLAWLFSLLKSFLKNCGLIKALSGLLSISYLPQPQLTLSQCLGVRVVGVGVCVVIRQTYSGIRFLLIILLFSFCESERRNEHPEFIGH